jgi:tryptophanyl-tRNA synthetase
VEGEGAVLRAIDLEAVLLVVALVLVLMGLAPVAPEGRPRVRLRERIARQIRRWDSYVFHDPRIWYPRD